MFNRQILEWGNITFWSEKPVLW